ncbi:NADH dehydrogenase subunit 5, partial [Staphylococcus arlettae]
MDATSGLLTFMIVFVSTLIIAGISGVIFINKRVPLSYIKIHIGISALPPLIALIALINIDNSEKLGPFHFDILAWLMAFFVLVIGLIIQRFSMQYLKGDFNYRKYFVLFQLVTSFAA